MIWKSSTGRRSTVDSGQWTVYGRQIGKGIQYLFSVAAIASIPLLSGCLKYSFSGASTKAKSIQVDAFFNNTELGPANFGQTVTNRVKDYFQQNSSLRVVPTNGELQIEGTIITYATAPISPQASTGSGATTTPNYGA